MTVERSSLLESSERLRTASPVFIIGHPRSGTSMLFATLLRHPAFRTTSLDLHESQIMRRLSTAFWWNEQRPRQLLGFMLGDKAEYRRFLDETSHLRLSTALTAPAAVPLRGRIALPLWRQQKLHLVVRSFFDHAWRARGCQRLVDKSPRNVPHIRRLRRSVRAARCYSSPGTRWTLWRRTGLGLDATHQPRGRMFLPRSSAESISKAFKGP